jgi:hypothetical protein
MFSLALKNAILMVLIILIIHFLIKNYLKKQQEQGKVLRPTKRPVEQQQQLPRQEDDDQELYNFVFNNKAPDPLSNSCTQPPSSNLPLPFPFKNTEPFVQQESDLLGTFSKCDYSKFGSPL